MRADFFWRTWNSDKARIYDQRNARECSMEVPAGSTLAKLLDIGRKAGVPLGDSHSGVYEIQTDEGIWNRADNRKIRPGDPLTRFTSWETMEREDGMQTLAPFKGG